MTSPILVTGGAGFIGQNFVHSLLQSAHAPRIVVLDKLTYAANPTSLSDAIAKGQVILERGDITDLGLVDRLFALYGFDRVAHFAAESHVDRSISGPDAFIETNILGTYNLLKCALSHWRERDVLAHGRFLHVSTDEVFGDLEADEPAFVETSPYKPSSPYSASKASSDHLVRAFGRTYGLPVLITNCSNNYGPYQHPEKLIPLMIINAATGKPLPIYGDGQNIRDWLHVEDHCRALAAVLERGRIGATYNVGGRAERTNKQVVDGICRAIDTAVAGSPRLRETFPQCPAANGATCAELIEYVADRPGHDRRYAIDSSVLERELSIVPTQTFESGLAQTVGWYLANPDWWERALSGDFHAWIEENYGSRVAT